MQSKITEMALRTAVSSLPKLLTPDSGNAIEQIKTNATQRASEIVNANGTSGAIQSQINLQQTAIELAVNGLEIAYNMVCKQLTETFNKRLAFDKERLAGIAAFLLPTNKEEGHYTDEEWVIKNFIELGQQNPNFFENLGIHQGELQEKKTTKYFSVLPYYRMSDEIHHPIGSSRPLEKQRNAIYLFFKSAVPDILCQIDIQFQTDYRIVAFVESWIYDHNYLNNLRAPRFIIMSLCNLLWNLQHPVDCHTGVPLSLNQSKKMCSDVLLFLNQVLDEEMPPHLTRIGQMSEELISFIRKIEIQVKELHAAFNEELLYELNIEDVTNSAHHVLRIMDKSIYKLLYKSKNVISQKTEPDEKAADDIAYLISLLNQLINLNPNIMEIISKFKGFVPKQAQSQPLPDSLAPVAIINERPTTIIDALVIFCHLDTTPRHQLLAKLDTSVKDSAKEFAKNLRVLKSDFIDPLKEYHRFDVHKNTEEITHEAARCFIPLVTLIIEDYRVDVDRKLTNVEKQSKRIINGAEQTQKINLSANVAHNYYYWKLSQYLSLGSNDIGAKIDLFPMKQYRITQVTVLLDAIADLITKYQSFLQDESFQEFLIRFLSEVKTEYDKLEAYIEDVDSTLSATELNSRSLAGVLKRMLGDLNASLLRIRETISNASKKVEKPEFIEQQRKIFEEKLDFIQNRYKSIFKTEAFPTIGFLIKNSSNMFIRERNRQHRFSIQDKHKLKCDKDSKLANLVTKLPLGTKYLDLSSNQLGLRDTTDILEGIRALEGFPIITLDLSGNLLHNKSSGELSQIISCLPASLIDLDLTWNALGTESIYKYGSILQHLPEKLKTLNLSRTNLGERAGRTTAGKDLYALFNLLPKNLESLSLSNNNLSLHTSTDLGIGFAGLPKKLNSLDLSGNKFDTRDGPKLAAALTALPDQIKNLDLSANSLGDMEHAGLISVLNSLSANIEHIDLSGNWFNKKMGDQLQELFATFKSGLKSLIISRNYFGEMHIEPLTKALSVLPNTLEILDLSFNNLSIYSMEALMLLADSFGGDLRSLNLYGNNLGSKTGSELKEFLSLLPEHLEHLNLSRNDFCQLSALEITDALKGLRPHIHTLCLNSNDFADGSLEMLTALFKGIPRHIKTLEFRNNRLGERRCEEICSILDNIPPTLENISLEDNQLAQKTFLELKKIIEHLPKSLKRVNLSHNHLRTYTEPQRKELLLAIPREIEEIILDNKIIYPNHYHIIHDQGISLDQAILHQTNYTIPVLTGVASVIAGILSINLWALSFSSMLYIGLLLMSVVGGYKSYQELKRDNFFSIVVERATPKISHRFNM